LPNLEKVPFVHEVLAEAEVGERDLSGSHVEHDVAELQVAVDHVAIVKIFHDPEKGSFWVSDPLCLSSSSVLHFSDYSFLVHHPVNQDDQHLLAHATASDFTVTRHERALGN
jgi:hypothetical protein